jgi:tRNA(Ile)-lysidine synthase
MNVQMPEAGKYVVAVSGGVDSMVLLDVLRHQPELDLIVVHYDHGIRADSYKDRKLVQNAAHDYGLIFEYEEGKLDPNTSEAAARDKRYDFLRRMQAKYRATAIITAHHQDDMLETVILNMLRGTGRKGLSSLASRPGLLRPLLQSTKPEIYDYARQNNIQWREDSTNSDERYLRNYIRHQIAPKLGDKRQELLSLLQSANVLNQNIDQILQSEIKQSDQLQRKWFIMLPYNVSCEVVAAWLRQNDINGFDRPLIERLTVVAKTKPAGKIAPINAKWQMQISKQGLHLQEISKSRV